MMMIIILTITTIDIKVSELGTLTIFYYCKQYGTYVCRVLEYLNKINKNACAVIFPKIIMARELNYTFQ